MFLGYLGLGLVGQGYPGPSSPVVLNNQLPVSETAGMVFRHALSMWRWQGWQGGDGDEPVARLELSPYRGSHTLL